MRGDRIIDPLKYLVKTVCIFSFIAGSLNAQSVVEKRTDDHLQLWLEAEAGDIHAPMRIWSDNDASGGQYIEVQSGNNNLNFAPKDGRIMYHFNLKQAGIYKVWGRVIAAMHDEDAFWVQMDDDKWIKWKGIAIGCDWHWDEVHDHDNNDQVMQYNLGAGQHTLTFTYCMDQTRLDKILITNDLDYVPTEIGPRATAIFEADPLTPLQGTEVAFSASASFSTEGRVASYKWDFGDGGSTSGAKVRHTFAGEGAYNVNLIVQDESGLTGAFTKQVKFFADAPVEEFEYTPLPPHAGESVIFDASHSFDPGGKIVSYKWDFGDGKSGNGTQIEHKYADRGEHSVVLTVADDQGNTATKSHVVTFIPLQPKKVIFETDMCLDVDDVGALSIIHAMQNKGEAELLAVCFNEAHPGAAAAIDAINTWYGRGDIPVGIYKGELANPDFSAYLDSVATFPHDLDQAHAPSALEVYKRVLSAQPDNSVTIISVGFTNNLNDLLNAEPNLVARKVKELVMMAGMNNDGFNLVRHNLVGASENVIKNWPSPIVISQPGGSIHTGKRLLDAPPGDPVRAAFYHFFGEQFCGRPSWDEMATLYAVRGLSDYFIRETSGTGSLPNGYTWQMKPGSRSFLRTNLPNEAFVKIIEDLMLAPPMK